MKNGIDFSIAKKCDERSCDGAQMKGKAVPPGHCQFNAISTTIHDLNNNRIVSSPNGKRSRFSCLPRQILHRRVGRTMDFKLSRRDKAELDQARPQSVPLGRSIILKVTALDQCVDVTVNRTLGETDYSGKSP